MKFKRMWSSLFNEDFVRITEPVLTRWWTVGEVVKQVRSNLKKRDEIEQKCVNTYLAIASPNLCGLAITLLFAVFVIEAHLC